jgi:hypothetical protein
VRPLEPAEGGTSLSTVLVQCKYSVSTVPVQCQCSVSTVSVPSMPGPCRLPEVLAKPPFLSTMVPLNSQPPLDCRMEDEEDPPMTESLTTRHCSWSSRSPSARDVPRDVPPASCAAAVLAAVAVPPARMTSKTRRRAQACHGHVTGVLLQECHRRITKVLQECYKSVTRVLQGRGLACSLLGRVPL